MRTMRWGILCGIAAGLFGCGGEPIADAPAPPKVTAPDIEYDNAGLATIQLHDAVLVATWHTSREGPLVTGKSSQSFERREFRGKLTAAQAAVVWDWVRAYKVFELTEPNKNYTVEPRQPGFKSRLRVEVPDRQIALKWTADDTFPLLHPRVAAEALIDLCKRFQAEKEMAERSLRP